MEPQNTNYKFIEKLYNLNILVGPTKCQCGNNKFNLQKLNYNKTNKACFRCMKYNCKKRYPVNINTIFKYFPKINIKDCYEIIKCNICLNFNKAVAQKYLLEEKNIKVSILEIVKIYKKIREILYDYYNVVYETEPFAIENNDEFFATDESEFTHLNGDQIWVLNLVNTTTKDFRLVVTKNRNTETLQKFICKYIPPGNNIVTDGWNGYNFLNNIGYTRYMHNHSRGDFGRGRESTSYAETLWSQLKDGIKSTYKTIQNKDF